MLQASPMLCALAGTFHSSRQSSRQQEAWMQPAVAWHATGSRKE